MKKTLSWFVLIVFVLILSASPIGAQEGAQGRIIFLRQSEPEHFNWEYGDLYSWLPGESEPFQETYWGYNARPILSPDGTRIAYLSVPEETIEAALRGEYFFDYDRDEPSNIWVIDLRTREAIRIAEQPAAQGQLRTMPVWSPDSQRVAWMEIDPSPDYFGGQLVVYDFASGTSTIWDTRMNLGFFDGGIIHLSHTLNWGSFIMRTVWTYGLPGYAEPGTLLEVRDEGGLLYEEGFTVMDYPQTNVGMMRWVEHNGAWWIALEYEQFGWQILDPVTGERLALENPPLLQSMSGTGLRLYWERDSWFVLRADGSSALIPVSADRSGWQPDVGGQLALSPDGSTLIYIDEGVPYLWHDNEAPEILLPESISDWVILALVWSPMEWVTDGLATALPPMPPIPTHTPSMG